MYCMHASCMYVCMYVYMYVCMHACMHVCMYVASTRSQVIVTEGLSVTVLSNSEHTDICTHSQKL